MYIQMLLRWAILEFLITTGAALSSSQSRVHGRRLQNSKWMKVAKPHPNATIPVRIGLQQENTQYGEKWLREVSDPASPKYGQHWSPAKIIETFRPSKETYETVHTWLTTAGITPERITTNVNHWMTFHASVDEAETLLNTEYHVFEHNETGFKQLACDSYSIPQHLFSSVEMITPTVHFNRPTKQGIGHSPIPGPIVVPSSVPEPPAHPSKPKPAAASTLTPYGPNAIKSLIEQGLALCAIQSSPGCLRFLYSIPVNYQNNSANSFAMTEYPPDNYNEVDLTLFYQHYSQRQIGTFPEFFSVDGGQLNNADYNQEIEPVLDFDIANLVWPQQSQLFQVGSQSDTQVGFDNFLDAIDASFCTYEGGDNSYYDAVFPDSKYNGTAMCGLAGRSVLHSSGDNGVAGNGNTCWTDPDYGFNKRFAPEYPATCPWVLSIGATFVNQSISNIADYTSTQPECAVNGTPDGIPFFSGGGFSDYFAVPWYQQDAVTTYMQTHTFSYSSQFNSSGTSRGVPDVSANGWHYPVSDSGTFGLIDGTSASSPTFASILTLINQERLNVGKSSIGFVNPAFYANPSMVNDVTCGSSPGCGTDGFPASAGWDPSTGLGTPLFPEMLAYFLSLP